MKTIYSLLIFLSFFTVNAQTVSILDHNWTIEKIVTIDQTIYADLNGEGVYDQLNILNTSSVYLYYSFFGECDYYFEIDETVQDFYITDFACPITPGGSYISAFFFGVFVFQEAEMQTNEGSIHGPFDYSFREEDDLIYLDITNPEGSVATFWTDTLSSTDFENVKLSIYPNPTTNLLHIESEEATVQQIEIFNLEGKQVFQSYNKNHPIEVGHLSAGLYILKIQTEKGSLTKKFEKK
ncbi:T9SS type A sorting domain-containing protein [Psychroflexus salis]|uniref:Secretion system C-terminal sorting domain-containing protein n=1 Tax=Psychroflexus salis TaxID=1526574 RepID=A0A917ECD5_9FLAO|nr:T9SS type A sorting domain-containing protein [Psychroflexus salis]GGE23139.1 hypothetical protein GCM10010831_25060 [Psychroflexus salis]